MRPPFQQLIDAQWREVAQVAAALVGPDDVDRYTQVAWERAVDQYRTLRPTRNLRGWLLSTAAKAIAEAQRTGPDGTQGRPHSLGVPAQPTPPEPDEDVWECVRQLPMQARLALVLRYVADLDHVCVAEALNASPGATRRVVVEALEALRVRLRAELAVRDERTELSSAGVTTVVGAGDRGLPLG
ncbi:MAG: RNA polymerase sigma factor [Actinomycetes bacterium]